MMTRSARYARHQSTVDPLFRRLGTPCSSCGWMQWPDRPQHSCEAVRAARESDLEMPGYVGHW